MLLACLLLHLAWAFAMPITSAPDETAHIYRALSLWNGDVLPSHHDANGEWLVHVPRSVQTYATSTSCTRWNPDIPASCPRPTVTSMGGTTTVPTAAGRYFPLYYYVVGTAGHVDSGVTGFYAMRITSLLVASLLLALAVTTILRTIGPRWACLALPVAITPQVLWLGSVINPNAWELDAGLLTWAAGLALVSGFSPETPGRLGAKFALGASLLVLTRPVSPMWLALIVAAVVGVWLCLPAEARRDRRLLASPCAAGVATGITGLAGLAVWWQVTFDLASVSTASNHARPPSGVAAALRELLPDVPGWVSQTYGLFGWLDTPAPGLAVLTWLMSGIALFVLVSLGSRHRVRVSVVVAACVTLTVVVPLAFSLTIGRQAGLHFWQGRYTMPFAQGIALALGVLGAGWRGQPAELTSLLRAARPVVWLLWPVLGTLAFLWAMHRYVKGYDADWRMDALAWTPPGGIPLLVVTYVIGSLALAWSLHDREPAAGRDAGRDGVSRRGGLAMGPDRAAREGEHALSNRSPSC